jgi:hypothetical protein
MIVPFRIDPSSFKSELHEFYPTQEKRNHEDIIECWSKNGLLIYNGISIEKSFLFNYVKALPTDLRKNWELALQNLPRIKCKNELWDGHLSKKNLKSIDENSSLAIIQEDKALDEFGILDNDFSIILPTNTGTCEVLKFPYITRSVLLKNYKNLLNSHIKQKESFEKIWLERFHWLAAAENINHISVIDRYLLPNSLDTTSNEISGCERFLNFINRSATSKKYIKIYTSWGQNKRKSDYDNFLENIFIEKLVSNLKSTNGNNIRKITLEILNHGDFKEKNHARHIRFEDFIWDIDKGMSCLHGSTSCKEELTTSFKSGKEISIEYKEKEEYLSRKNKKFGNHAYYEISSSGFVKI